jgi:hypothetical protein
MLIKHTMLVFGDVHKHSTNCHTKVCNTTWLLNVQIGGKTHTLVLKRMSWFFEYRYAPSTNA